MVGVISGLIGINIAVYLLVATAFFYMFRKARTPLPWLAYVPILQSYPFFVTIGVSQLNFLWYLLPLFSIISAITLHWTGIGLSIVASIAYIVIAIRWLYLLLRAFRISPAYLFGLLGLLVPNLSFLVYIGLIVLLCIIGFHPNIQYRYPGGPPNTSTKNSDDQFWF